MGVLIWWGLVTPKFSVPPSGKTMRQTPKRFRGERTCSRSSITIPNLMWLGFHPPPGWRKNVEFFVCPSRFFVRHALSLRHAYERQSLFARFLPWSRWNAEMILMPLDRGRFVVVHPCSTFKNWGFSPPEGDRINRSKRPQNSKFAKHCGFWPP